MGSVILRTSEVSDKSLEKIETNSVFSNFFPEKHAVHKIMLKNILELGRPEMAIWRMRICLVGTRVYKHTQNM